MNNKIMKLLDEITNSNVPIVLCSDIVIALEQVNYGFSGTATLLHDVTEEDYSNLIMYFDEMLKSTCVFVAPKLSMPGVSDIAHISLPLINASRSAQHTIEFNNTPFKISAEIALTIDNDYKEIKIQIRLET